MNEKKIPLIAIIGPTAVGKTQFSLGLADKLNAEIISVDSRQVYRYLDVGTDKIDLETRKRYIHHMIDIVDPDQIYSAADFAADTMDAVRRIIKRGRVPLLIGGSALYYKALEGALSADLPKDEKVRNDIAREISEAGLDELYKQLVSVDPVSAEKIHPNDSIRISRALEVYRLTGKPVSWWYEHQERDNSEVDIFYIGLLRDRADLYQNIEKRVYKQFNSGYPEEVEWLLKNGYSENLPSMQGFGYKELVLYHKGIMTFDEAAEGDIRATKVFSRRQMTWFKHFQPAEWYNVGTVSVDNILTDVMPKCLMHLNGENKC